jgi:hypothetical protein
VNCHSFVYCGTENPQEFIEDEISTPGVNVWAGIWSRVIVEPCFFDGTIIGDSDLEMLSDVVFPETKKSTCDGIDFFWQQDGAPLHHVLTMRNFFKFSFQ